MRARVFPAFFLGLAPLLAAGSAAAQPAQPLDRLLPQIRRDHPGQFLDAEGASQDGNPHYHLKWLTPDGRVMWLDADARTGRVVSQSPGRDRFDNQQPRGEAQAGPPDRGDEGRGVPQRYVRPDERQPEARFGNRRQFDGDGENRGGFAGRNSGGRFERGGDRGDGNDRGFGNNGRFGGFGERTPANRDFGGGGRDRRGGR